MRQIARFMLLSYVVLAMFVWLQACGPANSPVEKQEKKAGMEQAPGPEEDVPNLPSYDVTLEQDCARGFPAKCYSVTTSATSKEDLEVLTRHFAEKSPEYLAVTISFYPPRQTADLSGTGFFFANEEVARSTISLMYKNPEEANVDEQVNQAMRNDGIYIISIAEEVESMTKEACDEWDTTTLGTPPPEWNCPGY